MTVKPRQPAPELEVQTVDGGTWRLSEQEPESFTLVVAYRGLHCPICKTYVKDLDRRLDDFRARGVEVIAVSSDDGERARRTREEWGLEKVAVGYGLPIDTAREWGLFISTSRGKTSAGVQEPARFSEPGLFLIKPDGTLYWEAVQSMPFARPHFNEVLAAVDFVRERDYPARGEA